MAIYDFSQTEKVIPQDPETAEEFSPPIKLKARIFSSLAARLFFLLLLVADLLWTCYSVTLLIISVLGTAFSWGKMPQFLRLREKGWVSLRRSLVCGVSLFLAIFSPAFGIMIACTYFLMYDKSGIEEVVPSSLQSQFKEFFPKGEE